MRESIKTKLFLSFSVQMAVGLAILILTFEIMDTHGKNGELQRVENRLRAEILSDGVRLIEKSIIVLKPLAKENSLADIQEIVRNIALEDPEIIDGVYMDNERRPWAMAYGEDTVGGTRRDVDDINLPLDDSMSLWAAGLQGIDYKARMKDSLEVIEFAGPITHGDKKYGVIRFGITTAPMLAAIKDADVFSRRSQRQSLLALISVGLIAFLFAALVARLQATKITKPIIALTRSARGMAEGDYQAEIKVSEKDETGQLAAVFEVMRLKIRTYMENLHMLVEEKVQQIRDILENVDQGLLTFDLDLKINPDFSQKAKDVLQTNVLAGKSLTEILSLTPREESLFRDWISVVKRDHTIHKWARLSRLAPVREIKFKNGLLQKHVTLAYQKILDRKGDLAKIMVLAQDVTETRAIETRLSEEKIGYENKVKTILGVVGCPPEILREFLRDTEARIQSMRNRIREGVGSAAWVTSVFRDCHTIKGNAGAFGFTGLSNSAEEFENFLQSLKSGSGLETFQLDSAERRVDSMAEETTKINEARLTVTGDDVEPYVRLPERKLEKIKEAAQRICQEKLSPDLMDFLESFKRISFRNLHALTRKYHDLAARTAKTSGKELNFIATPGDIELDPRLLVCIDEALVHIIRNAIAHGIESKEERTRLGKGPGRVELTYERIQHSHIFKIRDDGKGIDLDALVNRAVTLGLITKAAGEALIEPEKLRLMYAPGLSTSATNDSVSGRGIGLSIVEESLRAQGATLSVTTTPGNGTCFTITLQFPHKLT